MPTMSTQVLPPSPVYVKWLDSVRHNASWTSASEFVADATYEQMVHHTLGWIVGEDDNSILIASSISTTMYVEPNIVDVIQIPALSVLERTPLELPHEDGTGSSRSRSH